MAVKTLFSQDDFVEILSHYALGSFVHAEAISQGTVQTNYFIDTTVDFFSSELSLQDTYSAGMARKKGEKGKIVFRYYENRSMESVLFECHLLTYLKSHDYPCPAPVKNSHGKFAGIYHNKPYVLFEFMQGQPIDHPNDHHKQQLIQKAAELQTLTRSYRPRYKKYRWNYNVELCRKLAHIESAKINTKNADEKFAWVEQQLSTLELPRSLPKGICHCDFHLSNVLFREGQFAALLDFDDANYTFLLFDLVGLIETWAWPYRSDRLDMVQARTVVQSYMQHRPLSAIEQRHLYDVYKLSILFDCIWYFGRGDAKDFYEKRKVDFLSAFGRKEFFDMLFVASGSEQRGEADDGSTAS